MGLDAGEFVMRPGTVEIDFGGEFRPFHLGIGQLRALQDKTGIGPFKLVQRLLDGTWHVDDVRETIYLGLIGSGMKMPEAATLVRRVVDDYETPLIELVPAAKAVLLAALTAPKDAPPGEPKAGEGQTGEPTTDSSPSPQSMATLGPLAMPSPRSMQ